MGDRTMALKFEAIYREKQEFYLQQIVIFLPVGSIRSIGICHPIKSSINGYCVVPKSRIDQVTESAGEIGEFLAKKKIQKDGTIHFGSKWISHSHETHHFLLTNHLMVTPPSPRFTKSVVDPWFPLLDESYWVSQEP